MLVSRPLIAPSSARPRLAAPSCVVPGRIPENCARLASELESSPRIDEIGLALFETDACLAYGPEDLPPDLGGKLSSAGVGVHAHLPLDLPWPASSTSDWRTAWEKIVRLERMIAYLAPRVLVLHPPPRSVPLRELARAFADAGRDPATVLIENVAEDDLLDRTGDFLAAGFGFCLDLGHIIAYSQGRLLDDQDIVSATRMLHLSAPDPRAPSRHLGLDALDASGRDMAVRLLALAPQATRMVEVFSLDRLTASLPVLTGLEREAAAC